MNYLIKVIENGIERYEWLETEQEANRLMDKYIVEMDLNAELFVVEDDV